MDSSQSSLYIAIGAIAGAIITGGVSLIRDQLNRKRDRDDERNRLIGELKGQKILTLQYYAFYFFSFIAREYLICRSIIQATYAINYNDIYKFPESERNKEIMRIADKAREGSIEYKTFLKEEEEINKWKLELAKSIKRLMAIIGSLQNYYSAYPAFIELSKQIEIAMDNYAQLEQTILGEFNFINQDTQRIAGIIPKEAYEEEKRIIAANNLEAKMIDILPGINKIKDEYYYKNIKIAERSEKILKEKRKSASKNLENKINSLIDLAQKGDNEALQAWRIQISP